jgi:hypothetical protein
MPRYYGRVPGKPERQQINYLTNPLWVVLGTLYLGCLALSLVFVTKVPEALILLTILAVPPLCRTIYRSNQQVQAGSPYSAQQWFGMLVGYLGKTALAGLTLALGILCVVSAFRWYASL